MAHAFRRSPHTPGFPFPGYGPRSGFLTRFAACSSTGLAGLFHPANALRLLPSGDSPPKEPPWLFARPCRLAVAPESSSLRALPPACQPLLARGTTSFYRLHGFAPLESPLRIPVRLTRACARAPLGLSPLQGLPPGAAPQLLAATPFVCFRPSGCRSSRRPPHFKVSAHPGRGVISFKMAFPS